MTQKIRVITLKKDIPSDTISQPGFHLLNMGKEGMWLVDEDHPGYRRCRIKAMQLAAIREDKDLVDKYAKLPVGSLEKKFPSLEEIIEKDRLATEERRKASKAEKSA